MTVAVPRHQCTLPAADEHPGPFTCAVCGQAWFSENRLWSGSTGAKRQWRRATMLFDQTIRHAYELEQLAAVLPRSSWLRRRRMRREAAAARRLVEASGG